MPKTPRVTRPDAPAESRDGVPPHAVPPATADEEMTIRAWRSTRNFPPVRGENGGGGFIGWANRLDSRVGARTGMITPRETHVPMRSRELYRELVRPPLLLGTIAWLALVLAVIGLLPAVGAPISLAALSPLLLRARQTVRQRRISEMRSELAAIGHHR